MSMATPEPVHSLTSIRGEDFRRLVQAGTDCLERYAHSINEFSDVTWRRTTHIEYRDPRHDR